MTYPYLLGLFLACSLLGAWILSRQFQPLTPGTKRVTDEAEQVAGERQRLASLVALDVASLAPLATSHADVHANENKHAEAQQQPAEPTQSLAQSLAPVALVAPVAPVSPLSPLSHPASPRASLRASPLGAHEPTVLTFDDVGFSVPMEGGGSKKLLRRVTGYAGPGCMTALMGASGAGKTTLLDVLARRKTQGEVTGRVLLNGRRVGDDEFMRLTGYVEQVDLFLPTATVRECVLFSARLRLGKKGVQLDAADSAQHVRGVLELVGLGGVADCIVTSLSPSQNKRLSMAVELAADPTVLFLDEPTTGLDSKSALSVVRAIRAISASGRTVVCTIHQPSATVFSLFDRLLLLTQGGRSVYFGDIGQLGKSVVDYFERVPGRNGWGLEGVLNLSIYLSIYLSFHLSKFPSI